MNDASDQLHALANTCQQIIGRAVNGELFSAWSELCETARASAGDANPLVRYTARGIIVTVASGLSHSSRRHNRSTEGTVAAGPTRLGMGQAALLALLEIVTSEGVSGDINPAASSRRYDLLAKSAKTIIERRLQDPELSVRMVATALHVTPSHLERVVRAAWNTTVARYIKEVRMQHALQCLIDSPLSIKEVSAKCGFRYVSTFDHEFKRSFGCRPGQWRELVGRLRT